MEFNQERADPSLTSPIFDALSGGTLTPSKTVTFILGGDPPPFAVIFSDVSSGGQAITVTTVIPAELSSTTGFLNSLELERVAPLIIPTLTAATLVDVVISYTSAGDSGVFDLQTITLSPPTITGAVSNPITTPAPMTSPPTITPTASPSPNSAIETSHHHRVSTIIGGTIGAVVGALILLLGFLLWTRRRRRLVRPATFHGDRMVKSPDTHASEPYFEPFTVPSRVYHSQSRGSSRHSSVDGATEKTPAMRAYSRTASSQYSDDDQEQEQTAIGGFPEASGYTRSRTQSRLSAPRTDRQMELEERIHDLKAQMISLSDGTSGTSVDSQDSEIQGIKSKIKQLEELQSSDWALERTNQTPYDLLS